jgi:outer membrane cobalamin receptor
MRSRTFFSAAVLWMCGASIGQGAIFGVVTGLVEDPQHRPVPEAAIVIRAELSSWQDQTRTDSDGKFSFPAVPAGAYTVAVTKPGFQTIEQHIVVRSSTTSTLTVDLQVGAISETVNVSAAESTVNTKSVTTESLVTRDEIERTPGAIRTNSLDLITEFVPGSYLIHDQLHVRGGHQVSWLVDGVPVPNTKIATTVGPQFDPKDIDTIEIQRGGYSAEFGDRTFGVFNVVTRSGFERNREAEVVAAYGNPHETNDQFSMGDHTNRFAYYTSVNANRTDLGLQTPVPDSIHNRGSGVGGFVSLISKSTATDQIRLAGSVRADHYEVPNSPDEQAAGIDDHQRERDGFVNLSWLRTIGSGAFLTVSPFYHYSRAALDGGPNDPIVTTDHRTSQYIGGQAVLAVARGPHTARIGAYGFHQHDEVLFGSQSSEGPTLSQSAMPTGHVEVAFAEDQFAATDWLTINGGVRVTHFSGATTEYAVNPRVGAAVRIPQWNVVVRGFYGRYYQPPPLTTVSGPFLELAADQGFGFLPLKGERDQQYEMGVAIPVRGWTVDLDQFRTNATNFFDHDAIGNSNIFIPLTIDTGRIRGWEATLRSPRRARLQAHLAYSHQFVEGRGGVSGGLTSFEPPSDGFFFLDHDQRDTLTGGINVEVDAGTWLAASIGYGSGFLEGDGPGHKPAHATVNLQASRTFGKQWTAFFTALNVGDTHFLLDESKHIRRNAFQQFPANLRGRSIPVSLLTSPVEGNGISMVTCPPSQRARCRLRRIGGVQRRR